MVAAGRWQGSTHHPGGDGEEEGHSMNRLQVVAGKVLKETAELPLAAAQVKIVPLMRRDD